MSRRPHTSLQWTLGLVVLALGATGLARAVGAAQAGAANAQPAVVLLTSQQDHDRQMRLLKISGFPPGPDPYQVATYDEATANPYPDLPDPLVMENGTRVTTASQWKARRAEIKELFDREVYGRVPRNMPAVKWEVVSSDKGLPMGGGGFGGGASQPISDIAGDHETADRARRQLVVSGHHGQHRVDPRDAGQRDRTGTDRHAVRRRRSEPDARQRHAESLRAASGGGASRWRRGRRAGRAGRAAGAGAAAAAAPALRLAARPRPTGRRSCCRKAGATRC